MILPPGLPPAVRLAAVVAAGLVTLSPWGSPPLALGLGAALGLVIGNPDPVRTGAVARLMLQTAVVGLGFGMPIDMVLSAGASGLGYTGLGLVAAVAMGLLLGRWLRVEQRTSFLITAGTSVCGASAIAAVGPVIGATAEAMSVALATIFILNAAALYVFPALGHLLNLSQHQFAVWAALAIHDTSSVVGAAASFGPAALSEATVLKLARALWIVPLTLAAAALARRRDPQTAAPRRGIGIPWFIAAFVAAALTRSLLPAAGPAFDSIARGARVLLVLTLFLIGLGLTRATLASVGFRPMLQGVLLWAALGTATLAAVVYWV
ncbi:MAG TPA: putative sulfate exporter family transporter [Gemmatimonadales bacterium]|nr:putative sulfate exporter family transporter [Gemmatimonadales bacterium]